LLAAKLITHEHETHYGADRHIFKGTKAIGELLQTERAKSVLLAALAHPNPSEKAP
jgi:hypothetical protein